MLQKAATIAQSMSSHIQQRLYPGYLEEEFKGKFRMNLETKSLALEEEKESEMQLGC